MKLDQIFQGWRKRLPYHLSLLSAAPQFYAHVFHPAFNLDADDASNDISKLRAKEFKVFEKCSVAFDKPEWVSISHYTIQTD
jgi:hypothetical protein